MIKTIDELLQMPYWIIDILPKRVPKDTTGQFFAVERYYLEPVRLSEIKQKHINVILRLNCYMDICVDEEVNPEPGQIENIMRSRYVNI
jgi:hypothetical protein